MGSQPPELSEHVRGHRSVIHAGCLRGSARPMVPSQAQRPRACGVGLMLAQFVSRAGKWAVGQEASVQCLWNEAFWGWAIVPLQMWLVKVRSKQSPVAPSWT